MTLRFVHAADIHLDSPLETLRYATAEQAARLRAASRAAFTRLIDHCLTDQVDLLLLAGDIWDGAWKDVQTGLFFVDQVARLRPAGIPVVMILGNHDAQSQIGQDLTLPPDVHLLPAHQPSSKVLERLGTVVHGQSFAQRDVSANLAVRYPAALPGLINIGLLHTALGSTQTEHANYAPCSLSDLSLKGYDYWALGHVHGRQIVQAQGPAVAWSGVLQGRHIREHGAKGALQGEIAGPGAPVHLTEVDVDVGRFQGLTVALTGVEDDADLTATLRQAIAQAHDVGSEPGRFLALRLRLTGATPLHGRLLAQRSILTQRCAEIVQEIARDGSLILEGVKLHTQAPKASNAPALSDAEALSWLAENTAHQDPALLDTLMTALTAVTGNLPPEITDLLRREGDGLSDWVEDPQPKTLEPLIAEALAGLRARLGSTGEDEDAF